MDEAALSLITQPTSMQLSEVFDGFDEDGNLKAPGNFNNIRDTDRTAPQSSRPLRREACSRDIGRMVSESNRPVRRQDTFGEIGRMIYASNSKPVRRHETPCILAITEEKAQMKKQGVAVRQEKSRTFSGVPPKPPAKRQRTVKMLELHELPKPSHNQRHLKMKPRNQSWK